MIKIISLLLFFLLTFDLQLKAEVYEQVVVECSLIRTIDSENISGLYRVIRFGDTLFADYKHRVEGDLRRTDDVYFKVYLKEDFDELEASGLLALLESETGWSQDNMTSIRYWGIEESADDHFEMQLWQVTTASRTSLIAQWEIDSVKKCQAIF